jgi:hypothetical protein
MDALTEKSELTDEDIARLDDALKAGVAEHYRKK